MLGRGHANGTTVDCLGLTVLISMLLPVLLMIDGVDVEPLPCCGSGEHRTTFILTAAGI